MDIGLIEICLQKKAVFIVFIVVLIIKKQILFLSKNCYILERPTTFIRDWLVTIKLVTVNNIYVLVNNCAILMHLSGKKLFVYEQRQL